MIAICWYVQMNINYKPLKIVSACSGGRRPSSEDDGVGRNALCGALGGHFRRSRLWSAMVVMVQIVLIPTRHS